MFRLFYRHISDLLSSYIDDQLSKNERQLVEKHLADCPLCAQELIELKNISEKLKTWRVDELGPEFDNAVMRKIVSGEVERGQVTMENKNWKVFMPVGALVGILAFVLVFGQIQLYMKRGIQGRIRESADQIGKQFSPGMQYSERTKNVAGQYEPYYMGSQADRDANKAVSFSRGTTNVVGLASRSYGYHDAKQQVLARLSDATARTGSQTYAGYKINPVVPVSEGSVIVIQPNLPATGEGEKIIRTAKVRLEVENSKEAYTKITLLCKEVGGYLAASNYFEDSEANAVSSVALRIPKDKFPLTLDRLATLGRVENITSNSVDVSQEYANLKAHLDALVVVYNKMVEALERRQTSISEAVKLESELTPVLERLESLKNQIDALNNAISFTTVNVYFHEPRITLNILKKSVRFIREGLITGLMEVVKIVSLVIPLVVVFLFYFVLFVPVIIGIILLIRRSIRRFRRKE